MSEIIWMLHILELSPQYFQRNTLWEDEVNLVKVKRKQYLLKMHPDKQKGLSEGRRNELNAHIQRFNNAWDRWESHLQTVRQNVRPASSPGSTGGGAGSSQGASGGFASGYSGSQWTSGPSGASTTGPSSAQSSQRASAGFSPGSTGGGAASSQGAWAGFASECTGDGAGSSQGASGGFASGSQWTSGPSGASTTGPSAAQTPCPESPHCADFARKHRKKDVSKQLEYRFLYAAQAHCRRCLNYYGSMPNFNVRCHSSRMTAWDWAHTAVDGTPLATSPLELHRWLQEHDIPTYTDLTL